MELENLTEREIYNETETEDKSIELAQSIGLLPCFKVCCNKRILVSAKKNRNAIQYVFRCTTKTCRKEYSLRANSFFSKSKLSISQILLLIYFFVKNETNIESLIRKTKIKDRKTIVDWLSFLREICTKYFELFPILIGGPGKKVEIDEVHLVKRKNNVGRLIREQWCFGGYDVESKLGFIVAVADRRRETIWPLISQFISVGSEITADEALIYNGLEELGYTLKRVNHSRNFVNPQNGATTNHIESMWQKVKQIHKSQYGTSRTTLNAHLNEFMWRQRFGKSLYYFVEHIKLVYNIN